MKKQTVHLFTTLLLLFTVPKSTATSTTNPPLPDPPHQINPKSLESCATPVQKNSKLHTNCTGYTTLPKNAPQSSKLKSLTLLPSENSIQSLQPYALATANLPELTTLRISSCNIHTIDLQAFNASNVITELDLSFNKLEHFDAVVFSHLKYLTHLNLQGNPIHRIESVFSSSNTLTSIDLSNCKLHGFKDARIFSNLLSLQKLYLHGNNFKTLDWNVIDSINNINDITLHDNDWVCDCHVKYLIDVLQNKRLFNSKVSSTVCSSPQPTTWSEALDKQILGCSGTVKHVSYIVGGSSHDHESNATVLPGQDVYLVCQYEGDPKPTVTWLKNKIPIENSNPMTTEPSKYKLKYNDTFVLRKVEASDSGSYGCVAKNSYGGDDKSTDLVVGSYHDVTTATTIVTGGTTTLWVLVGVACVLIILLVVAIVWLVWFVARRRDRAKQEEFKRVVSEKFKNSNIDIEELTNLNKRNDDDEEGKQDTATKPLLLDNKQENSIMLPDVTNPSALVVLPSHSRPPLTRQVSEPYYGRPPPSQLAASQQYYHQEPIYEIPRYHANMLPRSGSAMSVMYPQDGMDLRRVMMRQQYRVGGGGQGMGRGYGGSGVGNYVTLPRRPAQQGYVRSSSRPVSPTGSVYSNYSTLSWRPNVVGGSSRSEYGVVSDGLGARKNAGGGSSSSLNFSTSESRVTTPTVTSGLESISRGMRGGSVTLPRGNRVRTPGSVTSSRYGGFNFEPIAEVDGSSLELEGGSRSSEPRYKRKKPPSMDLVLAGDKNSGRRRERGSVLPYGDTFERFKKRGGVLESSLDEGDGQGGSKVVPPSKPQRGVDGGVLGGDGTVV